jgi:hypothetical protein
VALSRRGNKLMKLAGQGRKVGIPQPAAQKYAEADMARKRFQKGGKVKEPDMTPQEVYQAHLNHVNARGYFAQEKDADQRDSQDWRDIAEHEDTFGEPSDKKSYKREPKNNKSSYAAGGMVKPRGCGQATRGFGKAMKSK